MKTVEIGRLGEKLAVKYLRKNRYRVLETNLHVSHNEIDIIAKNKEFLVFVEVKTRSTDETLFSEFGTPATAVDHGKQQRLISAARGYSAKGDFPALQPRFDVIEVYLNKDNDKVLKINHIINAFGAR